MSEITYKELEKYIARVSEADFVPVYLIYGEEFFYNTALEILSKKLLKGEDFSASYEVLEGDEASALEAIERVNTFTLLTTKKVVVLSNSRLFYDNKPGDALMDNGKDDFAENEPKSGKSSVERICDAVERGFPSKNYLIITAENVDKRRLLYKQIKEKGLIIDCSVPKGERKADKDVQNAVLNEQLKRVLAKSEKTMTPDGFAALYEMTGFDLRIFHGNIEKLIDYVGKRKRITLDDVNSVLKRTKSDPIFEITNAVSDRNGEKALYFAHFLISSGMHPLQITAALANQVRKMMICSSFIDKIRNRGWHDKISFSEFKRVILPMAVDCDRGILDEITQWDHLLNPPLSEADSPRKKKTPKPVRPHTDTIMVKNPNNAYPVYQLMLKSALFSMADLKTAMTILYETDYRLKSTALNPKLVLEKAIVGICQVNQTNKRGDYVFP